MPSRARSSWSFSHPAQNLACGTTRKAINLLVRREQLLINNARFVIISVEMRRRGELDEIFVTGFVLGQKHNMVVNIGAAIGTFFFSCWLPGATYTSAADDRLDVFAARRPVKNQSRREARRER